MHAMKPGLMGLITLLGASALCGHAASPRIIVVPRLNLELPAVMIAGPGIAQPAIAVQPETTRRFNGPFVCGCSLGRGFGYRVAAFRSPQRDSKLADPVAAIAAAYLRSRSVKAVLLDPEVPVSDYREGYFGSWVQDGVLVKEKAEFTDEMDLRRVFALLVEAIAEPDDESEWWLGEPGPKMSANDYRRSIGFVPELSFVFVGDLPLRVDVSATHQRLLVQAGDRWDVYALDRWSALALKALLTAQPKAL